MLVLHLRKVETFLGDSQHERGPHRHVCRPVPWHRPATVSVQRFDLLRGDAMPAIQLRKKFSGAGLLLYKSDM